MKGDFKGVDKDRRKLMKAARKQGWTIEPTNGQHVRWKPPNGGTIIIDSSTTSDHRAGKNLRARLRREGLEV